MKNKQAFTLIELLVVVLIIGILAAVALPQYQKAVEKARMTEALVALKQIKTAQENYFLANGVYTTNFEELPLEWQGTIRGVNLDFPSGVTLTLTIGTYAYSVNKKRTILLRFDYDKNAPSKCFAKHDDNIANQVCKSLGGTNPTGPSDCHLGSCMGYVLPQ